ncbi:MAG TPA: TIGR03087 family PEP-CTERM/XrtA system glycosyltransferase [Gemmata sp.]|nr:TIGR03087 family PEP-CTERM/XrtA system glycosyltransferase [Gemmata sp.]
MTPRDAIADRDPAPVLYLTHRVPFPPDKGDRIRNYNLLKQMFQRGRVWLACLADETVPRETVEELRRHCDRLAIVRSNRFKRWLKGGFSLLRGRSISEGLFAERGLRRVIREWAGETRFQAAVVSASSLVPYLRMDALARTPAVVDLVDVDSQKWLDFAAMSRGPKKWLYRTEARRLRRLEGGLPGWTRAVAVVSRAEADAYESFAGAGAATVASNGVDLEYFQPSGAATDLACVFVGAMDYHPNVDGAVWFAREVWPLVRATFPTAEFRIVGRKPIAAVEALGKLPGVVVTGGVPDVRPYVASSMVVVAPLRLARGVQNKVLEALAMGKPVVAAPPALAALGTVDGVDVLSAAAPREFAAAVCELLGSPSRCRELGAAGRRYVELHHHWDRCLQPLIEKIFIPDAPASVADV